MDDAQELKGAVEDLRRQLHQETTRLRELERRCVLLEKLASHDPATGLRTENNLHARVREEVDRSTRYPAAATIVTICVPDNHTVSISRLGQRLVVELRCTDQVFQLADAGLAILLVETGADGAERVLQRIADEIEQFASGYGYSLTAFPEDANLADDFLRLALERHRELSRRVRPHDNDAAPAVSRN